MSLSRGTVPNPSRPGLIGQLTEGSQKSSLQNGLKRRTLRPRANRCLRQHEDFSLPSSWNDLRKEIQREESANSLPPKSRHSTSSGIHYTKETLHGRRSCLTSTSNKRVIMQNLTLPIKKKGPKHSRRLRVAANLIAAYVNLSENVRAQFEQFLALQVYGDAGMSFYSPIASSRPVESDMERFMYEHM